MGSLWESNFYARVREERQFCMILAHLLLHQPSNTLAFVECIKQGLPAGERLCSALSEDALLESQVYVEFSFLRDEWAGLGKGRNDEKRKRIFSLLSKAQELHRYQSADFPEATAEFNKCFMGDRGLRIRQDVVYPGQWSVSALHALNARRSGSPEEFRALCRFKWSFNIKPDLVLLIRDCKPICVEAKLESGEGWYPKAREECEIFDDEFKMMEGKGRVHQIELQNFMFKYLLDDPCQSVVLARDQGHAASLAVSLTWDDVFGKLDRQGWHPFVRDLLTSNSYIRSVRSASKTNRKPSMDA